MSLHSYTNIINKNNLTLKDIDSMSDVEFKSFSVELLKILGYTDIQLVEDDVDIIAFKENKKYAVKCINSTLPLNTSVIDDVPLYNSDVNIIITNSTFNNATIELAKSIGTLLWDRSAI